MMNNNTAKKIKIVKNRPRRTFKLKDKENFYLQWKESGLPKNKFCREKDLVHSAFANWCKIFSSSKANKNRNDWVPVVTKEHPIGVNSECLQVQIKLSTITKVWISVLFIILFFMELRHAIAVIR